MFVCLSPPPDPFFLKVALESSDPFALFVFLPVVRVPVSSQIACAALTISPSLPSFPKSLIRMEMDCALPTSPFEFLTDVAFYSPQVS